MPQGGIEEGEDPAVTASRELFEETGVSSARIVAEMPRQLQYDFPPELLAARRRCGRDNIFRGQQQTWYLMLLEGDESEVNLSRQPQPEFSEWKWMPLSETPKHVAHFKEHVYQSLVEEFEPLIQKHLVRGQWR